MRSSFSWQLIGHTISRRSAAEGGADAPSFTSMTARRTSSTLTNASDQRSGGFWTVVRAECTAARLLPRWSSGRGRSSSRRQQETADEEHRVRERRPFGRRMIADFRRISGPFLV